MATTTRTNTSVIDPSLIVWSKASKAWGSAMRMQRNLYAFRVMVALSGKAACPSCEAPFRAGDFQVDKVAPELDYRPGNVTYLCAGCNQHRSNLQSVGRDWANVAAYAEAVTAASASVEIPSLREAREWWQGLAEERVAFKPRWS